MIALVVRTVLFYFRNKPILILS